MAPNLSGSEPLAAGHRLLEVYAGLGERGRHLLEDLIGNGAPQQWRHYPEDDAIDSAAGYQWFYHSHSPEDRPGATEHGHFHIFARRTLWHGLLRSETEKAFASLTGNPRRRVDTRHLLAVGINAKGVPISLFTVNSWVTGDLMLSALTTERMLAQMRLKTGYPEVDAVLEGVIMLCRAEICQALAERDAVLSAGPPREVLIDQDLELLSERPIDLDAKLAAL